VPGPVPGILLATPFQPFQQATGIINYL
jgi:hypothetical protein